MRKVLIIIGIIALTLIVGIFVFLKFLGSRPAVPADYIQDAETGGPIEAKYMAAGGREVSAYEEPALQGFSKYTIYYPSELETTYKKIPCHCCMQWKRHSHIQISFYPGTFCIMGIYRNRDRRRI